MVTATEAKATTVKDAVAWDFGRTLINLRRLCEQGALTGTGLLPNAPEVDRDTQKKMLNTASELLDDLCYCLFDIEYGSDSKVNPRHERFWSEDWCDRLYCQWPPGTTYERVFDLVCSSNWQERQDGLENAFAMFHAAKDPPCHPDRIHYDFNKTVEENRRNRNMQ